MFAAELSGFEAEKQWHGAIEPAIVLLVSCTMWHVYHLTKQSNWIICE